MRVILSKSNRNNKKYEAELFNEQGNRFKTVHFGGKGYEDYTMHQDNARKESYLRRHKKRENWSKAGICTAGFWSRWLLWNEKTIPKAIRFMEKKLKIKIKNQL